MKIKRYMISRGSAVSIIVTFVISLSLYCILNSKSVTSTVDISPFLINALLVISSVTGTNLLTSLILERHSKNKEWRDIISADILSNSNFYRYMDEKAKWGIFSAVKYSINGDNNTMIQDEIMSSVLEKLKFDKEKFYFEKCAYDVKCKITDDYVEYRASRVTELYSYKNKYTCKKFRIAIVADLCDNGYGIEDMVIKLNGEKLREEDYIVETEHFIKEADIERNGYNEVKYIYLKKPLQLFQNNGKRKGVTMVYEYTAKSSLSDLVCTYRASKPCKHFSVRFELLSYDKYQLISNVFGFLDSSRAEEDTNSDYTSYSEFKDWIFEDDGVVISIVPRKK